MKVLRIGFACGFDWLPRSVCFHVEIQYGFRLIPVRIILSNPPFRNFNQHVMHERPTEDTPLDAPNRRRLPPLLRKAWYSLNQAFRRKLACEGITPDQFTALRWLVENEGKPTTQKELADLMSSDANTIASLVKRMESSCLIKREVSRKDRRANMVNVTLTGKDVYLRARQIAIDLQLEVLSDLSIRQAEEFLRLLERVADAAGKSAGRG